MAAAFSLSSLSPSRNHHHGISFHLHFHRRSTSTARSLLSQRRHSLSQQSIGPQQPEEEAEAVEQPSLSLLSANRKSLADVYPEVLPGFTFGLIENLTRQVSSSSISAIPVLGDFGLKDKLEAGMIWKQRAKNVEAEERRKKVSSPGFSFSAGGLLFPYHLGAAQCLIDKGYIKETTPLAGSSAGAIICAVVGSGSSIQEALRATKHLAEDCRLKGTAFRLGAVLRETLNLFLPDDVHTRCNGRIQVAVTQILWRPRGWLVDQFESKEDLINAVYTSSFIPGYLAPSPATLFRNRLCIDGGLTLFMPPTSAAETVRVCAFPAAILGLKGIGISPDCNPENRPSIGKLFNWSLEPAKDYVLDELFEFGYMDASVWAEANPIDTRDC